MNSNRSHYRTATPSVNSSLLLVIVVVGLVIASQAAKAGIDDVQLYYRYVPYQPPGGAASQGVKPSSGPSGTEVAKPQESEQAQKTDQPAAAGQGEQNKQPSPSEQVKKMSENPMPNSNAAGNLSPQQLGAPACAEGTQGCPGNAGQDAKQQPAASGDGGQKAPASGSAGGQSDQGKSQGQASTQTPSSGQANPTINETTGIAAGKIPDFAQIDVNGDHYVTKDELQKYPDLLKNFDKVDAGKDGRLEQHEFQNLEMEAKREGEIF
ncbi:MAG: hypothetical protein ACXWF8_14625 [Methylobacter sp.]